MVIEHNVLNERTISRELQALTTVDLAPVVRFDEVWSRSYFHASSLHATERRRVLARLMEVDATRTAYGYVVTGSEASGKTHFLASLRQEMNDRPEFHGASFLYADLWSSTSKSFWRTLLCGIMDSLTRRMDEDEEETQLQSLLVFLLGFLGKSKKDARTVLRILSPSEPEWADAQASRIVDMLEKDRGLVPSEIWDVLRSLFALNGSGEKAASARRWLTGEELELEHQRYLRLSVPRQSPLSLFTLIAWTLNLRGVVLLAVRGDPPEAPTALAEATMGLASIVASVPGVLTLLATSTDSWANVRRMVHISDLACFSAQGTLKDLPNGLIAQALTASRLNEAYRKNDLTPPYPTWPFRPEAFSMEQNIPVREFLACCARHIEVCLVQERIIELDSFSGTFSSQEPPHLTLPPSDIDPRVLLEEERENELGELIEFACELLLMENPSTTFEEEAVLRKRGDLDQSPSPLHALIEWGDGRRYCAFRVLQKIHASNCRTGLWEAMSASGLSGEPSSCQARRLFIFRSTPLPQTPDLNRLIRKFEKEGGHLVRLVPNQIAMLLELRKMRDKKERGFDAWLKKNRPISASGLFEIIMDAFPAEREGSLLLMNDPETIELPQPPIKQADPLQEEDVIDVSHKKEEILLGLSSSFIGQVGPAVLPLNSLRARTLILADEGGGKTVLLCRIIEESALCGVPSIIIDGEGVLPHMADRPPFGVPQGIWLPDNALQARRYFEETEVAIWTPALPQGRPLPSGLEELLTCENGRTRISIVSLVGFPSPQQKMEFIEHLTVSILDLLIKKGSTTKLRALLAIDGTHAIFGNAAEESGLTRLVRHAENVGTGFILTTRRPAEWNDRASNSLELRFLGQHTGNLEGVPRISETLKTGEFLMSANGTDFEKISVAVGYSAYGAPLTPHEIIERARPR